MMKPVSAFKPIQVTTHLNVHEPSVEKQYKVKFNKPTFHQTGGIEPRARGMVAMQ